ncbi:MAG TPA: HNH endonuclease signature motif containing protein [Planctomycetota bacterium]|nr:HNH endonuclease signature motif containing protein [Planctomycetota bacterium]
MIFEAVRSGAWAVLCFHVQENEGYCSMRRLSVEAGVGVGRVSKAVNELIDANLILRVQGNYREANRYSLLPPRAVAIVERAAPCFYCGRTSIVMDHVTPRSKGGRDVSDNLVPSCFRCNTLKGTKTAQEYITTTERLMWEELETERSRANRSTARL